MSTSHRHRRVTRKRWLALLAVTGLVIAACSNADEADEADEGSGSDDESGGGGDGGAQSIEGVPGVTDDAISYVALGTSAASAPNATCSLDCYVDGIEAYFAYRNDQGGVDGRQLELTRTVDDELANNQVRALEVLDADDAFGIFSYALAPSGFADIAAAGVPLYTTVVSGAAAVGQDSTFVLPSGILCITCSSLATAYLAEQVGATKVASLGYGIAQASKDCVAGQVASIEEHGPDLGIEVAYANDELPYGLPNGIAPEVTAMKEADVDLVLTCLDGNAATSLAQELQRQGMEDVVVAQPGERYGTPAFFEQAGDLFEGDVTTVVFRPFEADANEAMDAYEEWIDEVNPDSDPFYSALGWLAGDLAYQGLVEAGPEFDRASVIEATNAIGGFTGGGLTPPVDWGRTHEPPTPDDPTNAAEEVCLAAVRIVGDGYELLGEADAPWACWDTDRGVVDEPEFRDFA